MVTAVTTTTAVVVAAEKTNIIEAAAAVNNKPPSSSSLLLSEPNKPFHLLMVMDDVEQRVRLEHPKLRRDYLSQRYEGMESLKKYQLQQQQQLQLQQQQQALAKSKKNGSKKTPPATTAVTTTTTTTAAAAAAAADVAAPPKEKHPFWSGASDVERSLVSCCQIPTKHYDNNDNEYGDNGDDDDMFTNSTVPGALDRDKILHFVGLLAVKCTGLGSRALALAILERSWEADQEQAEMNQEGAGEADTGGATTTTTDDDGSPARKRLRRNNNNNNDDDEKQPADKGQTATATTTTTTTAVVTTPPQSDCLVMSFLMAGGLRILNQWLIEALTPPTIPLAPPKTPPSATASAVEAIASFAATRNSSNAAAAAATALSNTSTTTTTTNKPSPFGPLLLPLLSFLAHMPFDQNLVKQSKINKRIRQLSKDVDAIVAQQQQQQQLQQQANNSGGGGKEAFSSTVDETLTDPRTGGLSVLKVQEAVNTLKSTWVLKQKASTTASAPAPAPINPFQSLKDSLQKRLKEVQEFESGAGPEPSWMAAAEAAAKAAAAAAATKAAASTCPVKRKKHATQMAEMARREREKERHERMKGDIRTFKEEHEKLLERLRKLKQVQEEQQQQAAHKSESRRRVRWKDGLGAASLQRKRDQLEEVFVFCKDQQDSFSFSSSSSSPHKTEDFTMKNDDNETTGSMSSPTDATEETLSEGGTENSSSAEDTEGELL